MTTTTSDCPAWMLEETLLDVTASVLRVDRQTIATTTALRSIGWNSVIALEVASRVGRRHGVQADVARLMTAVGVDDLFAALPDRTDRGESAKPVTPDGVVFCYAPTSSTYDMADIRDLADAFPAVGRTVADVGRWSGLGADVLLHRAPIPAGTTGTLVNSFGIAAGMLGVTRAVAESGLEPSAVSGISIGEFVAACAAGVMTDREMVDAVAALDDEPEHDDVEEATAFVFVPAGERDIYSAHSQVDVAVDYGPVRDGAGTLLMLAGTRSELQALAESAPHAVRVHAPHEGRLAYHTPRRRRAADTLDEVLAGLDLQDPRIPIYSSAAGSVPATEASDVRALLCANTIETVSIPWLLTTMRGRGARRCVAVGPFLRDACLPFPTDTLYLDSADSVLDVVAPARV